MTNDRTPTGIGGGGLGDSRVADYFSDRANYSYAGPKDQRRAYRSARTNTLKTVVVRNAKNKALPILESTLTLYDFSDGGGMFQANFGDFPNRYYQSICVDPTHPGFLMAAPAMPVKIDNTIGGNFIGFHGINAFSTMLFGVGSVNDHCLYKETSATDPTPVAITGVGTAGRPAAAITGLYSIAIGGATTALQVLQCLEGILPKLITDAAGTLNVTALHANWNPTWWAYVTSLGSIVHQSGNSIYNSLTPASAVGDAPTVGDPKLSGTIHRGGYGIKECQLTSTPRRLYFVEPTADTPTGMLKFGSETLGYVESVNLDGTDLQRLDFVNFPIGISQAMFCVSPNGGGIIATDGKRVAFHDGTNDSNLGLFEQLVGNAAANILGQVTSGISLNCRGFETKGGDVFAIVDFFDTASHVSTGKFRYDWAKGTWNRVSSGANNNQSAVQIVLAGAGGNPVSVNTGFAQEFIDFSGTTLEFLRQFLTTTDENPYLLYRRTIGAASSTGILFATCTTQTGLLTPIWSFDGLEGHPSVVSEIECWGDPWAAVNATDGVYVAVYGSSPNVTSGGMDLERSLSAAAGVNASFLALDSPPGKNTTKNLNGGDKFLNNRSFFNQFQAQIGPILNGINYNVNCLPVIIHWYTFLDDVIRSPLEVQGLMASQ